MAEKWADRADLHTHTTASDGTLSPRQLVALAGELGLGAVAITDHDTVAGLAEGLAAGEALGVRVVPGVELSTSQAGCEVHIVGLFIRPDSPALLAGMPVAPVEVEPGGGGLLTRIHIAEALARKGWAATPVEAMERYLLPGRPGWVEKNSPSPKACGAVIHQAGGLAYLAHLDRIGRRDRQRGLLVARQVLEEAGLDGLEARYATYDRQWEALADSLAAERGLLRSGGSDFHGDRKPNRLGEGLGQLFVPVAWAEKPEN